MKVGTLFSGGGLADLGYMAAGFEPAWGVEWSPKISEYHALNIPGRTIVSDVCDVDFSQLESLDLLHSSPPCTNFSVANANRGETDMEIQAAFATCLAIQTLKPRWFTLENVIQYRESQSFAIILDVLAAEGYHVRYRNINTANHGIPQTRRRLILIADQRRTPHWPAQTHADPDLLRGRMTLFSEPLKPWVGWYEAIEDLLPSCPETKFANWQIARLPQEMRTLLMAGGNASQRGTGDSLSPQPAMAVTTEDKPRAFLMMTGNTQIENPTGRTSTQGTGKGGIDVRNVNAPSQTVRAGSNHQHRAFLVDGTPNSCGESGNALAAGVPSMTVKGQSGSRLAVRAFISIEDNQSREPTVRESEEPTFSVTGEGTSPRAFTGGRVVSMTPRCLARFQSVPDSYILPENKKIACLIIGNGCPPKLMEKIGQTLLENA